MRVTLTLLSLPLFALLTQCGPTPKVVRGGGNVSTDRASALVGIGEQQEPIQERPAECPRRLTPFACVTDTSAAEAADCTQNVASSTGCAATLEDAQAKCGAVAGSALQWGSALVPANLSCRSYTNLVKNSFFAAGLDSWNVRAPGWRLEPNAENAERNNLLLLGPQPIVFQDVPGVAANKVLTLTGVASENSNRRGRPSEGQIVVVELPKEATDVAWAHAMTTLFGAQQQQAPAQETAQQDGVQEAPSTPQRPDIVFSATESVPLDASWKTLIVQHRKVSADSVLRVAFVANQQGQGEASLASLRMTVREAP